MSEKGQPSDLIATVITFKKMFYSKHTNKMTHRVTIMFNRSWTKLTIKTESYSGEK